MTDLKYIRVGIIDDDEIVRTVLRVLLSNYTSITFDIVLELDSLKNFNEPVSSIVQPDVILLDMNMPGVSGLEGIPILSRKFPESLIIMSTEVDARDTIMKCIQAGAKGYITKGLSQQELVNIITSVMEGGSFLSPDMARKLFDHIRKKNVMLDDLTSRQQEVVEGIAEGLSYKLIAYKYGISIDTVREHIKHIYKKLNINSKGELMAMFK